MLVWRLTAAVSALFVFLGEASPQGKTGTVVSCGTEKVRLTIQNHVGDPDRLSFEGVTHDGNLLEKLSDLGQRASHVAALSCAETERTNTTLFLLLAFVRESDETPVLDERGTPVVMKTIQFRFIGTRPHSYLEVDTARGDEGVSLLPEYGLLSKDGQISFDPAQIIDISDDPEFFRTHSIVHIDPVRIE